MFQILELLLDMNKINNMEFSMNKELEKYLYEEWKKFVDSSRFVWSEEHEKDNIVVHHRGTFTTSEYVGSCTDIHYSTDSIGEVHTSDEGTYYVYYENGEGKYFSTLEEAENEVRKMAWAKKKKKLTKQYS
jgi:hypothetical protein